jgi:pilus assembly protein CpaE
MFSVPLVLIGLDDDLATKLKHEMTIQSAEIEAEYRSVDAAIERLKGTRSVRRLLITHVESALDLKQVRRLAETLPGLPILALVETKGQPELLLQVNRAGASQVVPLPLHAVDLQAALSCLAIQHHPSLNKCSVIAFTSSVAGCGATTLATNFAYEIAVQRNKQTILVELAQHMGVIATNLDVAPTCTLADLLAEGAHIDGELVQRSLIRIADRFEILAGNQGVMHVNEFRLAGVLRVLSHVSPLAEFIVLDVPCTFSELQFEILGIADQVVIIAEQSIATIRHLKLMLDSLSRGPNTAKIHVVINRYDSYLSGLTEAKLAKTLAIDKIHTIPDDRSAVLAAANDGKLLRQTAPRSPALAAIDKIVEEVFCFRYGTENSNGTHLLSRLFSGFRK